MLIESLSGVRAYDDELTEIFIHSYCQAFTQAGDKKQILLGRDTRASGNHIRKMIIDSMIQAGAEIVDLGVCPTPTVQYEVEHLKADGGIVITASHNPIPWNGLKFIGSDGLFLDADQMLNLQRRRIEFGKQASFKKTTGGKLTMYSTAIRDHIEMVLNLPYVNPETIRQRKFKIVVDAVNGAGFSAIPELLESLGCEVVRLNCDGSLPFPHTPEPLPENLIDLMSKVKSEHADIGFAIDPDADRLAIISNEGLPLSEEYTLVLASMCALSKSQSMNKTVVTNLSTTMALDDVARQFGATVVRTPIGEINVAKKMREIHAVVGGEGNGGVILPDAHLGRDSLVGSALVLQFLSEQTAPISEVMKSLPHYAMIKKKIPRGDRPLSDYFSDLKTLASADSVNMEDGIKFIWNDRWVHLRPSNTEPIVRIYAEAPTRELAEAAAQPFIRFFEHNS